LTISVSENFLVESGWLLYKIRSVRKVFVFSYFLAILCRPYVFLALKDLDYFTLQSFDFERTR
jgi:hypothetical protein